MGLSSNRNPNPVDPFFLFSFQYLSFYGWQNEISAFYSISTANKKPPHGMKQLAMKTSWYLILFKPCVMFNPPWRFCQDAFSDDVCPVWYFGEWLKPHSHLARLTTFGLGLV